MQESDEALASSFEQEVKSRFTWRDLKNLSRYSKTCPLRTIALIDFDAFYAQCETVRLGLPEDQPLAVQQFQFIIALNYAAKAFGLKRITTPEEARQKCPDIVVQHVATWREGDANWAYRPDVLQYLKTDKACLNPYRKESRKAFELVKSKLPPAPSQRVEKASIDEIFLDLSAQIYELLLQRHPELAMALDDSKLDSALPMPASTLLEWHDDKVIATDFESEAREPDWDDITLCIGAEIVRSIRGNLYDTLKYTSSAGIAHNKAVAKLAAGHNKPDQQTIVRSRAVSKFLSGYKYTKIRGLGGKLGAQIVDNFHTNELAELVKVDLMSMREKLGGEAGTWVFNIIRGVDHSEVVERTQLQSMLAAKTFVPKVANMEHAARWLRIFSDDLMGRLDEQDAASNQRRPKVITLNHAIDGRFGRTRSRQMQIPTGVQIDAQLLFDLSKALLVQISHEGSTWPCLTLSVAVSAFEDLSVGNRSLTSYFTSKSLTQLPCADEQRRDGLSHFPDNKRKVTIQQRTGQESQQAKKMRPGASTVSSADPHKVHRTDSGSDKDVSMYECPKCNECLVSTKVLEHLDWHVAVDLQNTLQHS